MTVPPSRSLRALGAGLVALAIVAVGCSADPATDADPEVPASAPVIDEPDETDDSADDATDRAPTSPSPAPGYGTTRPPNPDAKPVTTTPAAKPAAKPVAKPVTKPAAIADGNHAGRLVSITTTEVTVKLVRILTGDEAIAAAKADGGEALDADGTLPNDMYIQDLDRVVTIPVAGDGGYRIYDCSGGCEVVGTTLAALATGQAIPYGGPNTVVNLTVDHGVVVSFEEQYLP